jgi:DNA segregation ATPase FtsK/SpoIIIE, S-DNA-T family
VCMNSIIAGIMMNATPDQVRFVMVDPKRVELTAYHNIPHLAFSEVIVDMDKVVGTLQAVVHEMEARYKKFAAQAVRNIESYNRHPRVLKKLPYWVVIIDELADLMMAAPFEVEKLLCRLAQLARATGIHLVVATQRPSVDVVTGLIKANFPTRIAFQVTSKIDSRTILGEMGAEQLLGQGDMLYMAGGGRISRVHGPFASDEEVEKVVRHLKTQGAPEYLEAVTAEEPSEEDGAVFDSTGMGGDGGGDLFSQAVAIVKRDRKASTSYIQRRLQIGYNRAASLMERMELEGIVGQANHAGKREILVEEEEGGF